MPSAVHNPNITKESLALLTSRYSKSRPGSLVTGAAALAMAPWTLAASGTSANTFVPTSIAGCELWLRADLGTTIATGVSAWADQSGTSDPNKNAVQATGSRQPTLNASDAAYNHKATLSLAIGSVQCLQSSTWSSPIAQAFTIFLVGNDDGSSTTQWFFDCYNGVSETELLNNTGLYSAAAGATLFAGATSSTPKAFGVVFDGATSAMFISAKTATSSGSLGTNNFGAAGVAIGAAFNQSATLNGKIAEMIVYNSDIGSTNRNLVWTYFQSRYGISIGP